jgi:hypothetical protein
VSIKTVAKFVVGVLLITINIPLVLKVRDIISFSWAKNIVGHFDGFIEGAEIFLTPKLS